ncbi:hypothetical protein K3136_00845 [Qipengyuania gelatinilytica]|uniref:Uncharacterized protein n=2 Tax=Qipengyuania gelatinilytica TaxID=2867231 RepID=A0ABX9A837_9SPHN|nr:hypothetical protein K3136_00845 [Qipengyuania gelatinilytica]
MIARFKEIRSSKRTDGYGRWLLLIKELRVRHNVSILCAERMALENRHRRRWVEKQINTNQRCRKYALAHIRHNGDAALIEREGETFNFRVR